MTVEAKTDRSAVTEEPVEKRWQLLAVAERHWRATLFIIVMIGYCVSPVAYRGDAYLSVPTATVLVRHGTLDLSELPLETIPPGLEYTVNAYPPGAGPEPGHWAGPQEGWRYYDYFPWTASLFMVPTVIALNALDHIGVHHFSLDRLNAGQSLPVPQIVTASFWTALGVCILASVVANLLTKRDEKPSPRVLLLAGLTIGFATYAWSIFSRGLTSQTPNFVAISTAMLAATALDRDKPHAPRWGVLLGLSVALGLTLRPSTMVLAVALTIWVLSSQRRVFLPYLAGGAAIGVPYLVVNLRTFHSLVPPYFASGRATVQAHAAEALAANLVSPSRGLFITLPLAALSVAGVVLVLRRRADHVSRTLCVMLAAAAVAEWVVVSLSGQPWWAGDSFGSRYVADTLPVLVVLAVPAVVWLTRVSTSRALRGAGVAALVASLFINAQAPLSRPVACWNQLRGKPLPTHTGRVWSITHPQWLAGIETLVRARSPKAAVLECDADLPTRTE